MSIYCNIAGSQLQLPSLITNINGTQTSLTSAYSNIDGTQKQLFVHLVPLGNISAGSTVQFHTTLSGSDKLTEFIVLGKSQAGNSTLLLQKYIYEDIQFNSTNTSKYNGSDVDTYLCAEATTSNNYRSKISEQIRNCLIKTTIKSYVYSSRTTESISRDIFLLAYAEVGGTLSINEGNEGTSFLNVLRIAANTSSDSDARKAIYESGDSTIWWLRSSYRGTRVRYVALEGSCNGVDLATGSGGLRPVLSLDSKTFVDQSSSIPTVVGLQ